LPAVERRVGGGEDHPHAALPDLGVDAVTTEDVTDAGDRGMDSSFPEERRRQS
jgi:hypothetical protein